LTQKITIPCHTSNLKDVRDFVATSIKSLYLSEKDQFLLVLAVDEICANRILHSNQNDNSRQLEVVVASENNDVIFYIKDQGDFFDLTAVGDTPALADLAKERRKGGLGLSLIKKIIDTIEVFKEENYTIHRLIKKSSVVSQF
jgi:serine/threonine-protein kinase RsbW